MARSFAPLLLLTVFMIAASTTVSGQILNSKNELFELILVPTDLKEAARQMTIYDSNEDGYVDRKERERLPWRAQWDDFDLNRDSKITHIEIAVRQAKLRAKDDILEFDIKNVQTFLSRYDSNRNGQLDPDEISKSGWPSEPKDYDGNGDGTLTLRELATRFAYNRGLRREMGIEAVDNVGASRFIKRFDKDNDKKLDAEERAGAPLPKPADSFDDNGDGKLEAMELATMLAKHRRDAGLTKPDTVKIRRLFEMFDPEMDGEFDLARFASPIGENSLGGPSVGPATIEAVKQYDTNKDGKVTIKEVEAIVAKIRKERGYTEVEFERAKKMITRHDLNRSKHIELSELFDNASPGKLPKSLLAKADLDGDGKVGLDELARHFAKEK